MQLQQLLQKLPKWAQKQEVLYALLCFVLVAIMGSIYLFWLQSQQPIVSQMLGYISADAQQVYIVQHASQQERSRLVWAVENDVMYIPEHIKPEINDFILTAKQGVFGIYENRFIRIENSAFRNGKNLTDTINYSGDLLQSGEELVIEYPLGSVDLGGWYSASYIQKILYIKGFEAQEIRHLGTEDLFVDINDDTVQVYNDFFATAFVNDVDKGQYITQLSSDTIFAFKDISFALILKFLELGEQESSYIRLLGLGKKPNEGAIVQAEEGFEYMFILKNIPMIQMIKNTVINMMQNDLSYAFPEKVWKRLPDGARVREYIANPQALQAQEFTWRGLVGYAIQPQQLEESFYVGADKNNFFIGFGKGLLDEMIGSETSTSKQKCGIPEGPYVYMNLQEFSDMDLIKELPYTGAFMIMPIEGGATICEIVSE
jgi:hypothetical protein